MSTSTSTSNTTNNTSTPTDPIESGKQAAAYQAVDDNISSNQIIGLGSGSTIVYAVQRLAQRVKDGNLHNIICIPTSFQSTQLIIDNNLPLGTLNQYPVIDVTIDGADEVDSLLNCIKGGGACQLQEKCIASAAKQFIVIADYRKDCQELGHSWTSGIPIEVLPFAYKSVEIKLKLKGLEPKLRMAIKKAGPVVTDNGNFIIDATFKQLKPEEVRDMDIQLHLIPGIIETGLFVGMANKAYFGGKDGKVTIRTPQ